MRYLILVFGLLFSSQNIAAEQTISVNTDAVRLIWLGMCCALVLFMQVGFLMVEGGLVRSKNAVNVILKNFTDVGLGTVGYWMVGFGFMYGINQTGLLGLSSFFYSPTGTFETIDLLYNMVFAATAATIMSGAVAERFRFFPYVIGALFVTSIIYPIYGAWVWGGEGTQLGWLRELGFHDMAGASVVHSIGGWAALGALILIGPRRGRFSRKGDVHTIAGHNLPYVAVGGFFLWFGWFGFNGGAANDDLSNLGQILLNTHMGSIGGICGALFWLWINKRGFLMTSLVNGALGGLVSVTAGADVFGVGTSLLVGTLGGIVVVVSSNVLASFKIDDVVGAIPVHGFCGAWGTLAVGFFYQGDFFNIERIFVQLVGVVVALVWGLGSSLLLFWALSKVSPIRVNTREEQRGLDISEHKEIGYSDFMTTHARADV